MSDPVARDGQRVVDASVLLAVIKREAGVEEVALEGSVVSAVNWSETVQKLHQARHWFEGTGDMLRARGVLVVDFNEVRAEAAAALWARTRSAGLSLGDRACLALAAELGVPAVTADRAWAGLDVGVEVVVVR
ncbi:MAG: PIN domain-containing protein [Trueperaceae bacterium]|nr:PIN domain-containing protein [Trueperaceae bacterium]